MSAPLVVGRIHSPSAQVYFNNLKLFSPCMAFPVSSSVLADLVLRGRMAAGPVTALDFVRLTAQGCPPLADFGIFVNPYFAYNQGTDQSDRAALIHAPFVLLVKKPVEEYARMRVGVSEEILSLGTEALLLVKLLLSMYWEIDHEIVMELSLDDDAWLCQGGPYISSRSKQFFGFSYAYDLAWEWYRWKHAPYLMYRWVCNPDIDEESKEELLVIMRRTLELNMRNLAQLSAHEAGAKGLERGEVLNYLQSFGYRLGLWQRPSETILRDLASLLKESEISTFR